MGFIAIKLKLNLLDFIPTDEYNILLLHIRTLNMTLSFSFVSVYLKTDGIYAKDKI